MSKMKIYFVCIINFSLLSCCIRYIHASQSTVKTNGKTYKSHAPYCKPATEGIGRDTSIPEIPIVYALTKVDPDTITDDAQKTYHDLRHAKTNRQSRPVVLVVSRTARNLII